MNNNLKSKKDYDERILFTFSFSYNTKNKQKKPNE